MALLGLFGVLDVRDADGEAVRSLLAQPKRSAVLVVLALSPGGRASRDKVLGLLWPELPGDRARNALSKALHHIRGRLGEASIVSEPGDELRLDLTIISCDAVEFRELVARGDHRGAAALMERGRLLDSFHVGDVPEFEEWLEQQREAFRRTAVRCTTALAQDAEARGAMEEAITWHRRALELAPYEESTLRPLLRALARSGDRGAALEEYVRFEDRLRTHLDSEPSSGTRSLAEEIRDGLHAAPVPSPKGLESPTAPVRPPSSAEAAVPAPSPGEVPRSVHPVRRRVWLLAMGATAALAVVISAGYTLRPGAPADGREGDLMERVVVLPLQPSSNGASAASSLELASFGTVAADWVATALARTGVVEVVPARVMAETPMDEPGGTDPTLDVARRLGATLAVTGRFDARDDSLTVYANIVSPGTGAIVRSLDPIRGPTGDPSALMVRLHDAVAGALAAIMDVNIPMAATATSSPPNYPAYLQYTAGLEPWRREEFAIAARYFRQAFALDSTFVAVLPWLWEALTLSGESEEAARVLSLVEARRDRLGAYDLAALDWLRSFLGGDRQGSLMAGRRMSRLAPTSQDANWSHAWAAVNTNYFDEALEAFARVEALDGWMSDWSSYPMWPTKAHHMLGDYSAELALVREFTKRFPDDAGLCSGEVTALAALRASEDDIMTTLDRCLSLPGAVGSTGPAILESAALELKRHDNQALARTLADSAAALAAVGAVEQPLNVQWRRIRLSTLLVAGRWDDVIRAVEEDWEPHVRLFYRMEAYGIAQARLGHEPEARWALERMHEGIEVPGDSARFFQREAGVRAHMGDRADALRALRDAIRKGLSPAEVLHAQVALEPLWGDPEFRALLAPRH
jgi:DNA-binding SARP family transcriptional activator